MFIELKRYLCKKFNIHMEGILSNSERSRDENISKAVETWLENNKPLIDKVWRDYVKNSSENFEYLEYWNQVFIFARARYLKCRDFNALFRTGLIEIIKHAHWNKKLQKQNSWKRISVDVHEGEEYIDFEGGKDVFDVDSGEFKSSNLYAVNMLLSCLTMRQVEIASAYLALSDDIAFTQVNMFELSQKLSISEASVSQTFKKTRQVLRQIMVNHGMAFDSSADNIKTFFDSIKSNKYEGVVVMGQIEYVKVDDINKNDVFEALIPREVRMLYQFEDLETSMRTHGFDETYPLEVWKEKQILLDGYRRLSVAKLCEINTVPVRYVSLADEGAAIKYIIQLHCRRKSITDFALLNIAQTLKFSTDMSNEFSHKLSDICNISIVKAKQIIDIIGSKKLTENQVSDLRNERITIKQLHDDLEDVNIRMISDSEYKVTLSMKVPDKLLKADAQTWIKNKLKGVKS